MIEKMKKKILFKKIYRPYSVPGLVDVFYAIQLDLDIRPQLIPLLDMFTYCEHPKSVKIVYSDEVIDLHTDKYNNLILRIYEVS